ncbi:MAG: hypothetical protein WCY11_03995 [Novosphingobium sp.]
MIAASILWASALAGPDARPLLDAVKACDRRAVSAATRAEPARRADFAALIYAQQQAIAAERAGLLANRSPEVSPAGQASLDLALAALDGRQRQLDDARVIERSWRELVDELRADFLANCTTGKRHADD